MVTTHSPYVIAELPVEARVYVMRMQQGRDFVTGVSPDLALTKMDEETHPELDVYVEDSVAGIIFEEIIASNRLQSLSQCEIIPYGSASVGKALGLMVAENRFPRKSIVRLDGDQEPSNGYLLLPGEDSSERVVFEALREQGWPRVAETINRSHAEMVNAIESAMTSTDHHDWIRLVADRLIVGGNELWRAMCISWAQRCLNSSTVREIMMTLDDAVNIGGLTAPGRLFTAMDYMPTSRRSVH